MKSIPLSTTRQFLNKGKYVALVDDEDYEWASQYFWSANVLATGVYAVRCFYEKQVQGHWFMHREVWKRAHGDIPEGVEIDHKDSSFHRGLDNRRSNLRLATRSLNMANAPLRITNTSGFKGVWWDADRRKWQAKIKVNYRQIHLGRYGTAEEAAKAYDAAARNHFGEFARVNFAEERASG